jgi:hypothetical protein
LIAKKSLYLWESLTGERGAVFDCVVGNGCGSARSDAAGLCIGQSQCRGDFNNDNQFNTLDIQGFVDGLMANQGCP